MKHYTLNTAKFRNFIGTMALTLVFGAMGLGLVYAILMSPEW